MYLQSISLIYFELFIFTYFPHSSRMHYLYQQIQEYRFRANYMSRDKTEHLSVSAYTVTTMSTRTIEYVLNFETTRMNILGQLVAYLHRPTKQGLKPCLGRPASSNRPIHRPAWERRSKYLLPTVVASWFVKAQASTHSPC